MKKSAALRSLFAVGALLAMAAAHAQNITVTAANAANDAIYNVTFNNSGGGSISILNTDGGSLHNLVSLAFYTNLSTFQVDLIAADNGGEIVRYPGDFKPGMPTTGTVIFAAGGTGPANPDALSVDPAGNLYVVNAKPGNASNPQVWVLPANNAGGFNTPVQIDANFSGGENLQETLLATSSVIPPGGNQPVVNAGDLLVLTSNPSAVLRYAGSGGGNGPIQPTVPTILLNLPVGTIPGGLAFWPLDNSLLVTTSRGTIYQFHLTSQNETPGIFASGLGNGQFKIRTGIQAGVPYAYVANNNGGDILQFAGPGLPPRAVVTSGVQHPQGLAVSNANYAPISACQGQACDLLGNVITHNVPSTFSGNIVEDVCVVSVDPRLASAASCTTSLPVAQVCGGYATNAVIPASLCGGSGPTGKGFALIKALTQGYSVANSFPFNGQLILNDSNVLSVLPPSPTDPVCNPSAPGVPPLSTLAWAPLSAQEGVVVEGNNMLDVTNGCDGSAGISRGLSLFGIGLALNPSATGGLTGFATDRYTQVLATVQAQVNENPPVLPAAVTPAVQPPNGNFTYRLQQCISTSKNAFAKGTTLQGAAQLTDFNGAALEALAADAQVAAVAGLAAPFTADSDYPNPSGELRSRLQTIYYTINTRIVGNQAATAPPALPPPPPSPSIGGSPATTAKVNKLYSFTPTAADFAGNKGTLSFSIVNLPSWATFSTTTGQLSGTPPQSAKGKSFPGIVITVTDGCANASLAAFTIQVN